MCLLDDNDPEFDDTWINDLLFKVKVCHAEIIEYFENNTRSNTSKHSKETLFVEKLQSLANTEASDELEQRECDFINYSKCVKPSTAVEPFVYDLPSDGSVNQQHKSHFLVSESDFGYKQNFVSPDFKDIKGQTFPPTTNLWYNKLERDTDNAYELILWLMLRTQKSNSTKMLSLIHI